MPPYIKNLLNEKAYPHPVKKIELRETHVSWVFLTGDFVYKVKKPVKFGDVLDYSTLERRKKFCHEELRLNKRLAKEIYLDVVTITDSGVSQKGEVKEYAVKMKQLPEEFLLQNLLRQTPPPSSNIFTKLGKKIAEFHQSSEIRAEYGEYDIIFEKWDENFRTVSQYRTVNKRFSEKIYEFMETHKNLFKTRQEIGKIRDNHGDIQARNIFVLPTEEIYIFDCIEFNEALRCGDVIEDMAFLAMDLDFYGFPNFSEIFVHSYNKSIKDPHLSVLLPFYKAYRAYVRAKVALFQANQEKENQEHQAKLIGEAEKYFSLAYKYIL